MDESRQTDASNEIRNQKMQSNMSKCCQTNTSNGTRTQYTLLSNRDSVQYMLSIETIIKTTETNE